MAFLSHFLAHLKKEWGMSDSATIIQTSNSITLPNASDVISSNIDPLSSSTLLTPLTTTTAAALPGASPMTMSGMGLASNAILDIARMVAAPILAPVLEIASTVSTAATLIAEGATIVGNISGDLSTLAAPPTVNPAGVLLGLATQDLIPSVLTAVNNLTDVSSVTTTSPTTPLRSPSRVAADIEAVVGEIVAMTGPDAAYIKGWIRSNFSKITTMAFDDYTAVLADKKSLLAKLKDEWTVTSSWLSDRLNAL